MSAIASKLIQMGIDLTDPPACGHPILRSKQTGNLLFVSGHGSTSTIGKLGENLSVGQGYEAAREACIHCLEAILQHTSDLDKVSSFVKVYGMVNATSDFTIESVYCCKFRSAKRSSLV